MESEEKTAPKRDPLEVLKGFGGILPNKLIFATPPIYKEVYPNDPSKWPVYKVKPSDGLDFNEQIDKDDWYRIEDGKVFPIAGKIRVAKLKKGLRDWKNHRDGMEEIPFPRGEDGNITDDGIRSLKPELQIWLLGIIAESDSISKEESEGLKF